MLPVNINRVEELIGGLAKFGKTEAGITRLAYTSTDKAAQMWLLKQIAPSGTGSEHSPGCLRFPSGYGDPRRRL